MCEYVSRAHACVRSHSSYPSLSLSLFVYATRMLMLSARSSLSLSLSLSHTLTLSFNFSHTYTHAHTLSDRHSLHALSLTHMQNIDTSVYADYADTVLYVGCVIRFCIYRNHVWVCLGARVYVRWYIDLHTDNTCTAAKD